MSTNDTSGPLFTASSPSAGLQYSLESKLRRRLDVNGSRLCVLTWSTWDMRSGPPICRLRASARRTSASASGLLPTPDTGTSPHGHGHRGGKTTNGRQSGTSLQAMARAGTWPPVLLPTPAAEVYGQNRGGEDRLGPIRPSLHTMARHNLWPTPRVAASRTSRTAAVRADSRSAPSIEQVIELSEGRLPREVQSLEEMPASWRHLWPTPTAKDADAAGSRNTASSRAHAGISLTDAVRQDGGTGRLWPTPLAVNRERNEETMAKCAAFRKRSGRNTVPLYLADAVKLWPTPNATDDGSRGRGQDPEKRKAGGHQVNLQEVVNAQEKLWPTPHRNCSTGAGTQGREGGKNLQTAATWPTPASRDYRYPNATSYRERGSGPKGEQLPNMAGGPLNPAWVAWLMGFAAVWDACAPTATVSCRNARKRSSQPTESS